MNAIRKFLKALRHELVEYYGRAKQVGGYVHDTAMASGTPLCEAWGDTATWTQAAGQVANTTCPAR